MNMTYQLELWNWLNKFTFNVFCGISVHYKRCKRKNEEEPIKLQDTKPYLNFVE